MPFQVGDLLVDGLALIVEHERYQIIGSMFLIRPEVSRLIYEHAYKSDMRSLNTKMAGKNSPPVGGPARSVPRMASFYQSCNPSGKSSGTFLARILVFARLKRT